MMPAPEQIQWLVEGPEKWNARRVDEEFKPDFSGADLRDEFQRVRRRNNEKMMLSPIDLIGYNLSGANLKNVIIGEADLINASLRDADLSGAYLYGANLSGSDLYNADCSGADLAYVNLTGANLANANFSRADLSGIDFAGIDLTTTNLNGAKLTGARPVRLLLNPSDDSPAHNPNLVDYRNIITIEPDKRFGKPCIRGMRMTVGDVLEYLASGMTEAEILDDFPSLTHEDILACFAFAADQERRMVFISADTA